MLASQQKKVLRELIREVGVKARFEVVAAVPRQEGMSKKALRALARQQGNSIKKYLVERGVKKRDVSVITRIFRVGEQGSTGPKITVSGPQP